eukprot:8156-Amphidinium_carterae.2
MRSVETTTQLAQATEDLPIFMPDQPWDYVFAAAATSELEDAINLINLRLNTPQTAARVSKDGSEDEPPTKRSSNRPVSADRVHQLDDDGNFAANRRRMALCSAYQKDECSSKHPDRCPIDPGKAHECSKCLGLHAAMHCTAKEAPKPPGGKGKSKRSN